MPRRTFLGLAGVSAAGVLGARSALAARTSGIAGAGATSDALAAPAIDDLAAALEYDAERIFRFVADEIGYEPYAGALRGAAGTLASRAGNSVDQAVLLAALLQASLLETRFVSGNLDDATADQVLAGATLDLEQARQRAQDILRTGSPGRPPEGPLPGDLPPELSAIVSRAPELTAAAIDWTDAHLDSSVATIVDALAQAGVSVGAAPVTVPALERERHTWVQLGRGTNWVDLDPTIPGTASGSTIAAASGAPVEAIPDDLRHRVQLSVVAERVTGGVLTEQSVIDHTAFADELSAMPIALFHEKPDGLAGIGVAIGSLLGSGLLYQAVLQLGDDVIVGDTTLSLGGGDEDVFGTGTEGDREGEAIAEWLLVQAIAPDGATRTARRAIFDRVGDAARVAGAIDIAGIPPVELVSLTDGAADEFLPLRTLHFLSVATGATDVAALRDTGGETDQVAALGLGAPLYHVGRDAANAQHALERGVRTYLDGPNLVAYSIGAGAVVDGVWETATSIDLLLRSLATLPIPDVTAPAAPGIIAGVLSHVAERVQAGEAVADLLPDLGPPPGVVSVGAIIEAASAQGIGLRVFRDRVPDDLAYPPEAAAWLAPALADGWVAIGPVGPVDIGGAARLGWWLVDPSTGRTLDMLDTGGGATLAGYATKLKNIVLTARPWFCLGLTLYDYYHFIHSLIELDPMGALVGGMAGGLVHRAACH